MAAVARKTSWFAIWVSTATVVALIVAGAIVVMTNNAANDPGEKPKASNIDTAEGAVSFGSGTHIVDVYVDFMCSHCKTFEEAEGEALQRLVSDGTITLRVHPLTFMDRVSQGSRFSSRAASAMYAIAAADPGNAYAFLRGMYAQQPQGNTAGWTNDQIVAIAEAAGVRMADGLRDDIRSARYLKYAQAQKLPDGATGTPTLMVDGTIVDVTLHPETDILAQLP